jgi:hypothetical protein
MPPDFSVRQALLEAAFRTFGIEADPTLWSEMPTNYLVENCEISVQKNKHNMFGFVDVSIKSTSEESLEKFLKSLVASIGTV